jgi:hypothetical protein
MTMITSAMGDHHHGARDHRHHSHDAAIGEPARSTRPIAVT